MAGSEEGTRSATSWALLPLNRERKSFMAARFGVWPLPGS